MNALLVRVGADRSQGGGCWNGPVDSQTGEFVYVPIPESAAVHPGLKRPYTALAPSLAKFDTTLPVQLRPERLVYALVGLFVVDKFVLAADVSKKERDINAHARRILKPGAQDLIVHGRPGVSGRFQLCLPIGEYRDLAYRVRAELVEKWGGLSVRNGYLQRSARLPRFLDSQRFLRWIERQKPVLLQSNN